MRCRAAACRLLAGVLTALGAAMIDAGPVVAAATEECAGVAVVVEPRELGGAPAATCVMDEADNAAELFEAAEVELSWVQRQPGAVCQVDGLPADASCVSMPPGDAYWGLFWRDAASQSWVYATRGAGSLRVPAPGAVAFVWQGSEAPTPPSLTPSTATASEDQQPATGEAGQKGEPGDGRFIDSGLPTWLVLGLIALLSLAAVAAAYLRRRRGPAAL